MILLRDFIESLKKIESEFPASEANPTITINSDTLFILSKTYDPLGKLNDQEMQTAGFIRLARCWSFSPSRNQ